MSVVALEMNYGMHFLVFGNHRKILIVRAEMVFNKVKQPFKVYELDEREDESDFQDNLAILNGFRSVPQVYINGKCIGGGTDVKILYETGKLEPMLIG
ncbi:glutaredoxin-C8-like isoform X2 [Spodoptera litura]|uniref:Glutaredoxin-C8-like isoform X2 n=1 Tax=Spodoptera litura TaxID=69820 RepID=A0A9J7E2V6_SPOLT|nr:glutaredoxin-C8-like isoform X2 [Spodoptera litura]